MNKFPNKSTQFSSENQPEKRGRPKGVRNVATVLKELLSVQDDNMGGEGDFGSPIAKMLIKIAFSNDSNNNEKLKAIKEIKYDNINLVKVKPIKNEQLKKWYAKNKTV